MVSSGALSGSKSPHVRQQYPEITGHPHFLHAYIFGVQPKAMAIALSLYSSGVGGVILSFLSILYPVVRYFAQDVVQFPDGAVHVLVVFSRADSRLEAANDVASVFSES